MNVVEKDTKPPMDESLFHVNCACAGKAHKENYRPILSQAGEVREDHKRSPVAGAPYDSGLEAENKRISGERVEVGGKMGLCKEDSEHLGGGRRGLAEQREQTLWLEPGK